MFVGYALLGAVAGLHSACWGAYKDSLFEPFVLRKFIRSPVIGALVGVVLLFLARIAGIDQPNPGMFIVAVMAFERLFTESNKAFLRREPQEKYKIPQQAHVLGRVVRSPFQRILLGAGYLAAALTFFALPSLVPGPFGSGIARGAFWGALSGLASSFGGTWKDAPIEGFFPLKFFRSPLVGAFWGSIFSFFTSQYSFLLLACIGAERMTVELYKTFIVKRVPGKFRAEGARFPGWREKRRRFILPYVLTWVLFFMFLLG